jgi:hypothetical protein
MNNVHKVLKALVEEMISCHESNDFDRLKTLMDKSTLEDPDTFLTNEKFEEVCGQIHEQLGTFQKVYYIGQLNKKGSIHTLWKAQYSNTEEETLWTARINLDQENPKIIRMSVN